MQYLPHHPTARTPPGLGFQQRNSPQRPELRKITDRRSTREDSPRRSHRGAVWSAGHEAPPGVHLVEGAPMSRPSAVTHWLGDVLSSRTGWVSLWEGPRTGLRNSFLVSHPSLWGSEAKPLNLFFLKRHLAGTRIVLCELSGEDGNVWSEACICISAFSLAAHARAHTHTHMWVFLVSQPQLPRVASLAGAPKGQVCLCSDARCPDAHPTTQAAGSEASASPRNFRSFMMASPPPLFSHPLVIGLEQKCLNRSISQTAQ